MTRRKREIIGLRNERDFPYLVELALPSGGFGSIFLEIDAFHRERRIPVRRGRSRHEVKPFYIRFCFPDAATARGNCGIAYRCPCERAKGDRASRQCWSAARSTGPMPHPC
jgi:hypothetical protein